MDTSNHSSPRSEKQGHLRPVDSTTRPLPAAGDDDELKLAPVEASILELRAKLEAKPLAQPEEEPEPQTVQFTIREMLALTVFAAIGFAILRVSSPKIFAGAMGLAAIFGMLVISAVKPRHLIVHLLWWTVVVIYLVASVVAIARG